MKARNFLFSILYLLIFSFSIDTDLEIADATTLHNFSSVHTTVESLNVTMLGKLDLSARGLAIQGDYAYIGSGQRLVVVDISDPSQPTWIGNSSTLPDEVLDLVVDGNYAYVANKTGGLRVINISDPRNPYEIGSFPTDLWQETNSVALKGNYAYIGNAVFASGLKILNITDPSSPFEVGNFGVYDTLDIAISGDFAFLPSQFGAHGFDGLEIVNISNPTNPTRASIFSPDGIGNPEGVDVQNSYVYLAETRSGQDDLIWGGGLRVINVASPWNPIQVGYYNSTFRFAYDVEVEGNLAYIADHFEGLRVMDISNPAFPAEIGYFLTYGATRDVKVQNSTIYVADGDRGLFILRYTGVEPQPTPTPMPSPTPEPKISISHIEVTQGIQNIYEPVPLIAGKPALVRMYVDCGEGCVGLEDITGLIDVDSLAGNTILSPHPEYIDIEQISSLQDQRAYWDKTLNFFVPEEMIIGTVTFTSTVNGISDYRTFPVEPAKSLRIGYLSIDYDGMIPNHDRIDKAYSYMQSLYPLDTIDYFQIETWIPSWEFPNADAVLNYLHLVRMWYDIFGWPQPNGKPDKLFGWLPHATWRGRLGASDREFDETIAFGVDEPMNKTYQIVMAHEIGHLLGRPHPSCATQYPDEDWPYGDSYAINDVGFDFDVYQPNTLVDEDSNDFMVGSHCDATPTDRTWISAYTFKKLNEALTSVAQDSNQNNIDKSVSITETQQILLVSGQIYLNGTAKIGVGYQFTSTNVIRQSTGTDYCLNLQDSTNANLTESCFDLSFYDPESGDSREIAHFVRMLPYHQNAARLALKKDTNELAERLVSANYPSVTLITANGDEVITDTVDIQWLAIDTDDDPLEYALSYSADNGLTWHHLSIGITDTHQLIDTVVLPGSDRALFRVTVSDGINTTFDISDAVLSIPGHNPETNILSPYSGITIVPGQPFILRGRGYDLEEGILGNENLRWSSNLDGNLGTGNQLLISLSPGQHAITLTVEDNDNNTSTASINIFVGYKIHLPIILRGQGDIGNTQSETSAKKHGIPKVNNLITLGYSLVS